MAPKQSSDKQPAPRADQLAPHSVEAEEAVLGSILMHPPALKDVMTFLKAEDFFIVRHGWIWEALLDLYKQQDQIDILTVTSLLEEKGQLEEVGGAAYIVRLEGVPPTPFGVEGYARIVERMAIRRKLIDTAATIARLAHSEKTDINDICDDADKALHAVTSSRSFSDLRDSSVVGLEVVEKMAELEENGSEGLALKTGLLSLDSITDGQIQPGMLWYIVGESGHGKTTLATQLAHNFANAGTWTLYVSQEMTRWRLFARMAAYRSRVPYTNIISKSIKKGSEQYQRFYAALMEMQDRARFPLYIVSGQQTIEQVGGLAQYLTNKHGEPGAVVIDTMNKLKGAASRNGLYEGLTKISASADDIKLRTGCLVTGLVQHKIDREQTTDPVKLRPSRQTVKGTSAFTEDADILTGIYNADFYRRKFGESWNDSKCPPNHVLMEALKIRDGVVGRSAIFPWLGGIPMIMETAEYDAIKRARESKTIPLPTAGSTHAAYSSEVA